MWRTFRDDRVLQIYCLAFAGISLPFFLPILSVERLSTYSDSYAEPALILLSMGILLYRGGRIGHAEERRFWRLMAIALGCWLGYWIVALLVPTSGSTTSHDLAGDALILLYYLFVFLAVATKPHLPAGWSAANIRHRIESIGTLLFCFGLLLYFAVIPSAFNAEEYGTWLPSGIMYLVFDCLLLITFLHLRKACGTPRWRLLYGLIAASVGLWAVLDLVNSLTYAEVLPPVASGSPLYILWYLPYVPVALAARLRHQTVPSDARHDTKTDETAPKVGQLLFRRHLVAFASVLPLLHFGLYSVGLLDATSKPARELCVFAFLLVLGGLAIVQHRLLEFERSQSEEKIRVEKEFSEMLISSSLDGIFAFDLDCRYTVWNSGMERISGASREECLGRCAFDVFPFLEEIGEEQYFRRALAGEHVVAKDRPFKTNAGRQGFFEGYYSPLRVGSAQVIGGLAVIRDISERKTLEEQLRHSQKMEAVGQLAGGVAHDFNNLLCGIIGHAQLALGQMPGDTPAADDLRMVLEVSNRAAKLTGQLLAYARPQPLESKAIDLNGLIVKTSKMLDRVIGETVELRFIAHADLGSVRGDPGQIEQVLMNLTLNARDAMPDGGRLAIETTNVMLDEEDADQHPGVPPGSYVMFAVTDTGCGMDHETQKRIFEPFFTTKEVGSGTGLGLSTVHGIIKQHEGNIRVHSEVGKGTRFNVYLPRVEEEVQAVVPEEDKEALPRGCETILVVEDEETVRNVVRRELQEQGYRVLTATGPEEAEKLHEDHAGEIMLLLTDVVMPGYSGYELYRRVAERQPSLKVMFMSGYTGEAIEDGKLPPGEFPFMQKPFDQAELARKVRQVLDT